jgi:L-arabinokinase
MYRIVHTANQKLADVEAFLDLVNTLDRNPCVSLRGLFDPNDELFVTRAPGRLDVMGGIADYSGSLVLELPIAEATLVALQRNDERTLRIASLTDDSQGSISFEMPLADFEEKGKPVDYEFARKYFQNDPAQHWAAYVAGAFLVLMRERQISFPCGARVLISSQVPQGKGVSSSAALEVAVMNAIIAAFELSIEPREIALLCQKVENLVAGAPCGVMDQMTVVFGERDCLLALLCQPAELLEAIPLPAEIAFWGLDSGLRHSVSGADYESVRVGAFMGYRIIADLAGLKTYESEETIVIEDSRWRGYLSNVTPSEFELIYAAQIPDTILGAEFLKRYHRTTDSVTRVCPDKTYAVRVPTAHAIYEHHRVRDFSEKLQSPDSTSRLELLGELMYQSHASYSACSLGSDGTDRLVTLVREAGPSAGLFGAKITGGGSGGTVAVLGTQDARPELEKIVEQYARETGYRPYIFEGSSPGSAAFGYLKLASQTERFAVPNS